MTHLRAAALDGNLSNISRFLRSIESASVTADFRSGIVSEIRGQCRTDQDAKNLGDSLAGPVRPGPWAVPAAENGFHRPSQLCHRVVGNLRLPIIQERLQIFMLIQRTFQLFFLFSQL